MAPVQSSKTPQLNLHICNESTLKRRFHVPNAFTFSKTDYLPAQLTSVSSLHGHCRSWPPTSFNRTKSKSPLNHAGSPSRNALASPLTRLKGISIKTWGLTRSSVSLQTAAKVTLVFADPRTHCASPTRIKLERIALCISSLFITATAPVVAISTIIRCYLTFFT